MVVWVKCGRVMSGGIFAAWAKNESRRFPYSSVQCRTPSVQYGTRAGCTELGPGVRNSACPVRKPGRRTELEPGVRNSAGPVYGTRAPRYGSQAGVRNSACPVRDSDSPVRKPGSLVRDSGSLVWGLGQPDMGLGLPGTRLGLPDLCTTMHIVARLGWPWAPSTPGRAPMGMDMVHLGCAPRRTWACPMPWAPFSMPNAVGARARAGATGFARVIGRPNNPRTFSGDLGARARAVHGHAVGARARLGTLWARVRCVWPLCACGCSSSFMRRLGKGDKLGRRCAL